MSGSGSFDTRLAHFGEEAKYDGAVVPPLFANSLFVFDKTEDLQRSLTETHAGAPYVYSRVSNPTLDLAERKIADLEGTEAAKMVGCGMAAITDAVFSCVQAGSHVVLPDTAYGPARELVTKYLARFGVTHTLVDGSDAQEVVDAFRPETTLCYLESPTSAVFQVQDVAAITKVARERGITTAIDNTYATPLCFRPIEHGVDLVCHSATKYFSGHSDTTGGVVCGTREHIDRITRNEVSLLGNASSPFAAWLITRGLRTLKLRLDRHRESANRIAAWMETRPEVARVHHVSLDSHPQKDLYARQFSGSTGLFSFEPANQDLQAVRTFCDALRLFGRGISWGGFESLVVPIRVSGKSFPEPRWVVRLFIGLEDPEDLRADIEQALLLTGV
jgi:cystathionine beta-lyase